MIRVVGLDLLGYAPEWQERALYAQTDDQPPRFPCPKCGGATEITPSGALTCQRYGSSHYRVPWDFQNGRPERKEAR